jgi:hypothetical protein
MNDRTDTTRIPAILVRAQGLYLSIAVSVIFVLWMGIIGAGFPKSGQPRMVALEIAAESGIYRSILAGWLGDPPDSTGLSALRASFWVDFGFIAGYTLLLMSSLGNVRAGLSGVFGGIFRLPLWVGLLDVVENVFHLLLLGSVSAGAPLPDTYPRAWLIVASTASHGKWILFAFASFAILAGYVRSFRSLRTWPRFWIGVVTLALLVFDLAYLSELPR